MRSVRIATAFAKAAKPTPVVCCGSPIAKTARSNIAPSLISAAAPPRKSRPSGWRCATKTSFRLWIAALGPSRDGLLALWQVIARVIDQGSRLSAVRLARAHAAQEILGLNGFDE